MTAFWVVRSFALCNLEIDGFGNHDLVLEGINRKIHSGMLSIQGVIGLTGFSHMRNQRRKSNRKSLHFSKSILDDEQGCWSFVVRNTKHLDSRLCGELFRLPS